jgi:hypothetical protein
LRDNNKTKQGNEERKTEKERERGKKWKNNNFVINNFSHI